MEAIPLICAWWWCPVPGASGILSIGTDSDAFTQTLMRVRTKRVFYSSWGFQKWYSHITQNSCGCNKGFVPKPSQELGFQTVCLIHNRRRSMYLSTQTGEATKTNEAKSCFCVCTCSVCLPATLAPSESVSQELSQRRQVIPFETIVPIRGAFERSVPIKSINQGEGTLAACESVSQEPSQRRQVMRKKRRD